MVEGTVYLALFKIHLGTLTGKQEFVFDFREEFLPEFLVQSYAENAVPKEVVLPEEADPAIADYLSELKGQRVRVTVPQRGDRRHLLDLVKINLETSFFGDRIKVEALRQALRLPTPPEVVECFDISHLAGTSTVGVMVQFRGGHPDKRNYRRFRIRTVEGVDDFAAIAEVVRRRYARLKKDGAELPDLVVVDGGRGQLSAAKAVLDDLDLAHPRRRARQARGGGLGAGPLRAPAPRPEGEGEPLSPGGPRRSPPLRDHVQPQPAVQGGAPVTESFELVSPFKPKGSQPSAIASLVEGIRGGDDKQTLLGVTGSGKTFTIANVIEEVQRPTLVIAHNKTLAAQLYNEFRDFFPKNRVEYFVSYYDYYQPESYIPQRDLYIEKDMAINPKIEQMRLAATASRPLAAGHDHRGLGLVHLRSRQSRQLPRHGLRAEGRRRPEAVRAPHASSSRSSSSGTTSSSSRAGSASAATRSTSSPGTTTTSSASRPSAIGSSGSPRSTGSRVSRRRRWTTSTSTPPATT